MGRAFAPPLPSGMPAEATWSASPSARNLLGLLGSRMATTLNEERVAPLRAMVEDGLPSGPATPDTQKDQDELAAIARGTPTMVDLLFMPEAADVEFEPPRARLNSPPADFSDELARMPNVGRDEDFARSGEQARQDYQRTRQSRSAPEVFDQIQERIDARRQQWLSENKSALDSSNRHVEDGVPTSKKR